MRQSRCAKHLFTAQCKYTTHVDQMNGKIDRQIVTKAHWEAKMPLGGYEFISFLFTEMKGSSHTRRREHTHGRLPQTAQRNCSFHSEWWIQTNGTFSYITGVRNSLRLRHHEQRTLKQCNISLPAILLHLLNTYSYIYYSLMGIVVRCADVAHIH